MRVGQNATIVFGKEIVMKKFVLASLSVIALFGIAACSDTATDTTTTESVNPPATEQPVQDPAAAPTDPATGTMKTQPTEPAPAQ